MYTEFAKCQKICTSTTSRQTVLHCSSAQESATKCSRRHPDCSDTAQKLACRIAPCFLSPCDKYSRFKSRSFRNKTFTSAQLGERLKLVSPLFRVWTGGFCECIRKRRTTKSSGARHPRTRDTPLLVKGDHDTVEAPVFVRCWWDREVSSGSGRYSKGCFTRATAPGVCLHFAEAAV